MHDVAQPETVTQLVAEPEQMTGIGRGGARAQLDLDAENLEPDLDDGVDLTLTAGRPNVEHGATEGCIMG